MVTTKTPRLASVGVIAAELGVPVHRITYILRARPYIKPAAACGNVRVFDGRAVAMIRQALNGIDARRGRADE